MFLFLQSNNNSCNASKYCTYTAAAAGSIERVGLLQYMRVELFKNILVLYQNIFINRYINIVQYKGKTKANDPGLRLSSCFSHLH